VTAFRDAHASLAPLTVRELDFLSGIIACRIERLLEVEDDGERDEAEAELSLAA
jgi:hypothetical protein